MASLILTVYAYAVVQTAAQYNFNEKCRRSTQPNSHGNIQ